MKQLFFLSFFLLLATSSIVAQNAPSERKNPKVTTQTKSNPKIATQSTNTTKSTTTTKPKSTNNLPIATTSQGTNTCRVYGELIGAGVQDVFNRCSATMPELCKTIEKEMFAAEGVRTYTKKYSAIGCDVIVEHVGSKIKFAVTGSKKAVSDVYIFFSSSPHIKITKQGF